MGTGYLGEGLTFGTLAAMIITDQILGKYSGKEVDDSKCLGRKNKYESVFSPARLKPLTSTKFVKVGTNINAS